MILLTPQTSIAIVPTAVQPEEKTVSPPLVLPTILVEATRIAPLTGATIIDRETIENFPTRNGSLNEIIGIVPGVQFGEGMSNSLAAGEITPPNISISGSHFYENNFTIDGISNNSSIEPTNVDLYETSILPGHPQKIFLDPHLIEQVNVFNSNISAEHGGFTGGQVEVITLDPVDEFWGNINYRTTREEWTKFHLSPSDQTTFSTSNTTGRQPRFDKQDAGMTLNIPLNYDMGVLLSYQTLISRIPLQNLGETKIQDRKNENFFLKYGYHLSEESRLYLTGIYAPNEGTYFGTDKKNSDFRLNNDNLSLAAKFEQDFQAGQLDVSLGYSNYEVNRQAAKDKLQWNTGGSVDWGGPTRSVEGGLGDIEQTQKDIQLNINFALSERVLGSTKHLVKIGTELVRSEQVYSRDKTSYYYFTSNNNGGGLINCRADDIACIKNEQFLTTRQLYEQGRSKVTLTTSAAYIQDSIIWKRLELFPGVRLSHDDYLKKTNFSPRFAASYDLYGNGSSILFGGKNRYYSGTLLTYRLREAISPLGKKETRGITGDTPDSWPGVSKDGSYVFRDSELKTPYTDEITVGIKQKAAGGELKLQYIKRKGRDELVQDRTGIQPDSYKYWILSNNGHSKYESYQVSWQRAWEKHYLELNCSYQTIETSHLDYDNYVSTKATTDLIWYNGQFLSYDQIPKSDFNRPIIATLIYTGKLPFNLTFTNTAKFRSAYTKLSRIKPLSNHGLEPNSTSAYDLIYDYEKKRMRSSVVFDWHLAWEVSPKRLSGLVLTLDVLNVFNNESNISDSETNYELGRQLWVGASYDF